MAAEGSKGCRKNRENEACFSVRSSFRSEKGRSMAKEVHCAHSASQASWQVAKTDANHALCLADSADHPKRLCCTVHIFSTAKPRRDVGLLEYERAGSARSIRTAHGNQSLQLWGLRRYRCAVLRQLFSDVAVNIEFLGE